MDIDMVKSRETRNIVRLTNWRKDAKKSNSKESMTDSYESQNSEIEWLKIIETKNFVDDGMFLRMKITLSIWPRKNTLAKRVNGGFIPISKVLIQCHWGKDLISSKHCLHCIDCNKKQEKTTSAYLLWQTSAMGTECIFYIVELARFMVDSLSFWKSRRRWTKYWMNGVTCWMQYLERFFGTRLSLIQFLCYRWIVYSWRRSTVTDGVCQYITLNDPFSRCISVQ